MKKIIFAVIFFSIAVCEASSVKVSTLDNSLQDQNTIDVSLAQKKTERRGAWEGELSVGKTKTLATDESPETDTLDLTESIDYNSLKNWVIGLDAKQDHEDDGLNVVETGLSVQKKLFYTKPKKKEKSDDDADEPFYPSLAIKVRVAQGSTSEASGLPKKSAKGQSLPRLLGFKEKNEGLSFTWDFLESWSAGIGFTQYQYIGFDKTQAFLYAYPSVAERLSGATSSVSSVVDHEEVMNLQWLFADDWNVNFTETLQTDYVTGDVGSNSQIDISWDFIKNWELTLSLVSQRITAQPPEPTVNPTGTPAQTVSGGGLAIAYDW